MCLTTASPTSQTFWASPVKEENSPSGNLSNPNNGIILVLQIKPSHDLFHKNAHPKMSELVKMDKQLQIVTLKFPVVTIV